MNAHSQKEIAFRRLHPPSREPRNEEQSGDGIKVGDWATRLNVSELSKQRQTRYIKRVKLKEFVRADCEPWPQKAVTPLSGLRSSGISWRSVKSIEAARCDTSCLTGVVRSRRECQIGPQGGSPLIVFFAKQFPVQSVARRR